LIEYTPPLFTPITGWSMVSLKAILPPVLGPPPDAITYQSISGPPALPKRSRPPENGPQLLSESRPRTRT
jgi:hypothetical protein